MVLKSEALKQSIKDGFHTPDVEQCETPLNGPKLGTELLQLGVLVL